MDEKFERKVIDVVETGNKLKERRCNLGLEIKEVASLLGITERALYKHEEGKSLPSIDCFVSLSRLYGKTINDLLVLKNTQHSKCD